MKVRNRRSLVVNPFVSEDQRRACYAANDPKWNCHEWSEATGKRKLPKKVRKPTSNKRKAPNPLRTDPTRTVTLRRAFAAILHRQFSRLRGQIVKLIVDEDALGLRTSQLSVVSNLDVTSAVERAAASAEPNPTPSQVEAGNYRKGHVTVGGLPITIETAAGNLRKGKYRLANHYGYIKRTESEADGDHVDVFLGPHLDSDVVYVIDQNKQDGGFDEHKCMVGFHSAKQAKEAYLSNYSADWAGFSYIKMMSMPTFKEWIRGDGTGRRIKDQVITNENPEGCNQYKPCGTGSIHAKALEAIRGIKSKIAGTLTDYIDKVPGGKVVREKLSALNDKLGERYGPSTAKTIIGAAQVISWGAFTAGLATGHVVYVPSWGVTIVGAVLAEGYLQAHRGVKRLTGNEEYENLDDEGIQREAQHLYDSLLRECQGATENTRWTFHSDPHKIEAFQEWLKAQIRDQLTSQQAEHLWREYAERGFRKGAGRAFDDVNASKRTQSAGNQRKMDFYNGSRDQFLRDSFARPVAVEKVQLLAGRSFDELENVTLDMSNKMSRALTDGLVEGKGVEDIAKDLTDQADLGEARAMVVARTEMTRVHAEGQLTALENLGVEEVGVAVEWTTSGIYSVSKSGQPISPCEKCLPMEGVVLRIEEARNMIPRHPNCLCAWTPANVGEDSEDQKDTHASITQAIKDSGDDDWAGTDKDIDKERPESILNFLVNSNPEGCNQYSGPGCGGWKDFDTKHGMVSVAVNQPRKEILKLLKESESKQAKGIIHGNDIYVWADDTPYADHLDISKRLGVKLDHSETFNLSIHEGGVRIHGVVGPSETMDKLRRSFDKQTNNVDVLTAFNRVVNVFCATGSGGGKDPTCRKGMPKWAQKIYGGGKGKAAAPKKVEKPKAKVEKPKPVEKKPEPPPAPKVKKEVKSGDRSGSRAAGPTPATVSEPVAQKVEQPARAGDVKERGPDPGPAGDRTPLRVPADPAVVTSRIDRMEKFFRDKGQHEAADWMGKLREHVGAVGTKEALKTLGDERKSEPGSDRPVQYEHEKGGFESMGHFAEAYLDRHGIVSVHRQPDDNARHISSSSPAFGGTTRGREGDFTPRDPTLPNKLAEAKRLPGLERSEDINKLMGRPVTHLTDDVTGKLDEHYGKGRWIVKPYGDEGFNSQGVFFPQRVDQVHQDAKNTIHAAKGELAKSGFSLERDSAANITGIRHENGDQYQFGSEKYNNTIYGHAREWGDKAASAAPHERGAQLPFGGKEFMAQPAFEAVGVSNADRAAGRTLAPGEGRVHVVTRDGKAEVIPHSTWIKGEHLPVVFESADTKAMARAAVEAINALPKSERQGQIYAPDIIKARGGYKVVEANPANDTGSSGYLGDNPMIIDSYVSHITGREPAHVKFVRKLLSKRAENVNPNHDEKGRFAAADRISDTVLRLGKDNYNMVHLGDVRDAHPELSRSEFDAALHQARVQRKVTLSAFEGRHGATKRDIDSSIHEDDPGGGSGKVMMGYAHSLLKNRDW